MYVEEYVESSFLVSIKDNFCLGSTQHGFAVPMIKCDEFETNSIANNTAGSCKIGFIINTIGSGNQCQAFSYAKAFACKIGQISGSPGISSIKFDHFLMADNWDRSITLKHGASEGGTNHTAFLTNSYISVISRPNCAECYGTSAIQCTGAYAIRLFTASANGEVMPEKFGPTFDVICKQPVYDSKAFLTNVTVDNIKQTYTGNVSMCSGNFVFKPNGGARDFVGGTNLFDSKCTNCDSDSYLIAPSPSASHLGWFGGCGDILCTGFNNYLIQDHTGSFFGSKGTIIANNSLIADNEDNCTFSSAMNAHMCLEREDFAVLEYESVADDFNTRIMWPVYLTADGSNYTTATNAWREWEWLGNEPLNRRIGRFMSVIKLAQTYNMTYASEAPHKLRLQIQKRSIGGDNSKFIIVKLHYPRPNSIRVMLNNQIVDPILLTDVNNTASGIKDNLNTSQCGSNIYFYTNYTTHFVITEDPSCVLEVQLTESVQLTTHFAIDINTFFNTNNVLTNFIDNLCALLGVTDTSRVKVVGVHSGSTAVTVDVTPSSNSSDPTPAAVAAAATTGAASGTLSAGLSSIGLGSVISVSSVFYSLTADSHS